MLVQRKGLTRLLLSLLVQDLVAAQLSSQLSMLQFNAFKC